MKYLNKKFNIFLNQNKNYDKNYCNIFKESLIKKIINLLKKWII